MIRKLYLLSGLLILVILFIIVLTTRTGANRLFSPEDLTPTAVPPELLTQLAQENANHSLTATAYPPFATQSAQTEQALQLTLVAAPTSDIQEEYPIFSNILPRSEEILSFKPEGTLAGYGLLYESPPSSDSSNK